MDQELAQKIVGASLSNDNRMLVEEYYKGSSVIERDTLKLLWKLGNYEVTMKVNYKIEE